MRCGVCACEVWCVCVHVRCGVYESASVCPWPTTGLPC